MNSHICTTCGVQYATSSSPPDQCPICIDERQYVNPSGQSWTTISTLQKTHRNVIRPVEPGLIGIATEPSFAIGQRALLVQTPQGNILWDCISYIDDETVAAVNEFGGIQAIAISHPHFYDSRVEWSQAFDNAPIYLHVSDREWVMRPDPAIVFWEGETNQLNGEVTLVHCGGHFEGSTALHWAGGSGGKGALLTGDTIMVVADKRYVTFMYSYPNSIPLGAKAIQQIVDSLAPHDFDRIYSGWWGKVVENNAKEAVERSAARYMAAIG